MLAEQCSEQEWQNFFKEHNWILGGVHDIQYLSEVADQPIFSGANVQGKGEKELHKGSFLFMEAGQPLCLCCANLSELEYLPRGNAKLTRRVKKDSIKSTVVVEFSRSRKRYERQGILVEKESLRKARQELMIEDDDDDHK